jgi:hypothetical protein
MGIMTTLWTPQAKPSFDSGVVASSRLSRMNPKNNGISAAKAAASIKDLIW